MKPLEDLLPRIMPRAPRCPEPTALDAIRRAAMEFCQRTRIWRESDSFGVTTAGDNIICVPQGTVLFEIESARIDGRPLEPASLSWLNQQFPLWREETSDLPRFITQVEPDSVQLVPAGTGALDLTLILKPSDDAEYLPDWMIDQHSRVLADGALGEILTIPGQPFFNPQLAGFHAGRFARDLDRLSSAGIRGQQRAPVRTVPDFF